MSRRSRARRKSAKARTRKNTTFKRVVKRKPLNIRYSPIYHIDTLSKREPSRNKPLTTKTLSNRKKQKANKLVTQVTRIFKEQEKRLCKERKRKDDAHRRRKFFRAKSKGNATARPEHIRKYKRC